MGPPAMSISGLLVRLQDMGTRFMIQITPWERLVLELLAAGSTASQISRHFGVSEHEVALRLSRLFTKMGATSEAEAVAAASRRGLLRP
jgi:DNA-binding NarL/FixJ family response regulator